MPATRYVVPPATLPADGRCSVFRTLVELDVRHPLLLLLARSLARNLNAALPIKTSTAAVSPAQIRRFPCG